MATVERQTDADPELNMDNELENDQNYEIMENRTPPLHTTESENKIPSLEQEGAEGGGSVSENGDSINTENGDHTEIDMNRTESPRRSDNDTEHPMGNDSDKEVTTGPDKVQEEDETDDDDLFSSQQLRERLSSLRARPRVIASAKKGRKQVGKQNGKPAAKPTKPKRKRSSGETPEAKRKATERNKVSTGLGAEVKKQTRMKYQDLLKLHNMTKSSLDREIKATANLKAQIDHFEKILKGREDQIEILETGEKRSRHEAMKQMRECHIKQSKLKEATTTIKEAEDEIKRLKSELKEKEAKLKEYKDEVVKHGQVQLKAMRIEQENRDKDSMITELKDRVENLTKINSSLEQTLHETENAKKEIENKMEKLNIQQQTQSKVELPSQIPEKQPENILFIADSNGYLVLKSLIANTQGVRWAQKDGIFTPDDLMKYATNPKPEKEFRKANTVIIMEGINDTRKGKDGEVVAQKLLSAAYMMEEKGKNTVIVEIPPIHEKDNLSSKIQNLKCNSALISQNQIEVITVGDALNQNGIKVNYEGDGYHLTDEGANVVAKEIINQYGLEQISEYSPMIPPVRSNERRGNGFMNEPLPQSKDNGRRWEDRTEESHTSLQRQPRSRRRETHNEVPPPQQISLYTPQYTTGVRSEHRRKDKMTPRQNREMSSSEGNDEETDSEDETNRKYDPNNNYVTPAPATQNKSKLHFKNVTLDPALVPQVIGRDGTNIIQTEEIYKVRIAVNNGVAFITGEACEEAAQYLLSLQDMKRTDVGRITRLKESRKGKMCNFYVRTGDCKYGIECHYDHPEHIIPAAAYVTKAEKQKSRLRRRSQSQKRTVRE